jgi:hypothetical protein
LLGLIGSIGFVKLLPGAPLGSSEAGSGEGCTHLESKHSCHYSYFGPKDCKVTHNLDQHEWCFECDWFRIKYAGVVAFCNCWGGFLWTRLDVCSDFKATNIGKVETVRHTYYLPEEGHTAGNDQSPPPPPESFDMNLDGKDCTNDPKYPAIVMHNCSECPKTA